MIRFRGNTIRQIICIAFLIVLNACQPSSDDAQRAESEQPRRAVRVVTSGGFTAAYNILAPVFEKETGINLSTEYGASSGGAPDSIPVRLQRGENFDVVILSRSSLDNLSKLGYARPDTRRDLVRSSIGMAVREGAPVPDISSPEKFREVIFAAESIGYSASASGTYLSTVLFPKLGVWAQIESKSHRILSERVVDTHGIDIVASCD